MHSVRLRIGKLSGVEPQSLQFALEVCSRGTRAEGMSVEIERVPARTGDGMEEWVEWIDRRMREARSG